MGAHLDGSSIHDGIYVPQFQYDGVHTSGTDFDEDMFINIVKNWDEEDNYEFHDKFHKE